MKSLHEVLIDALELHASYQLPALNFKPSKKRIVIASGNALPTGKIIFQGERCVFADEGKYLEVLNTDTEIDSAVVISASGKKHAPIIIHNLLKKSLATYVITCDIASPGATLLPSNCVFVTKSNPELITYNTSTYMGMMLLKTRENPTKIRDYILQNVRPLMPDFRKYSAFYLMVLPQFDVMREMFITKFDELFGPRVVGRCYTEAQTFHAKTVISWDKELFVSFGFENRFFGEKKLTIPLPENVGYVAMMAIGYYLIGHIQEQLPQWFKESAERYKKYQETLPF
jgi:hypothetical protein